jgi:hypothetical protein
LAGGFGSIKLTEPFVPVSDKPKSAQGPAIVRARWIEQEEFGGPDKVRVMVDEPTVRD